jgi:hypothetical protein
VNSNFPGEVTVLGTSGSVGLALSVGVGVLLAVIAA